MTDHTPHLPRRDVLRGIGAGAAALGAVQWSAYMIFIVIIGGLGYLEGPLIGSLIFFALQRWLADYGVWYLVLLGAIAVAAAVWLPRGLWGAVSSRGVRLFGVGYRLDVGR